MPLSIFVVGIGSVTMRHLLAGALWQVAAGRFRDRPLRLPCHASPARGRPAVAASVHSGGALLFRGGMPTSGAMPEHRRFPPPWSVEEYSEGGCFIVRDHNGQALAYVYCEDEPGRARGGEAPHPDGALPIQRRAEDCVTVQSIGSILSEIRESTNVAREASFDEAKAQHQCSTGAERRRIVIVAGKRSVCRNWQACSGYADAENRNEPRNHSL
jgi:hypothetical protein